MRIQWDSALVAATAHALHRHFAGGRIQAVHVDPVARRLSLFLREVSLVWELHPERTGLRVLEPLEPPAEARRLPARLVEVSAPVDDRILILDTRRVRGRPVQGRIVLELIPRRENAIVAEGEDHTIRALLRTVEGERPIRRGRPWTPPPPTSRAGGAERLTRERWQALVDEAGPGPDRRMPYKTLAWSSPIARPLLEGADGYSNWLRLRALALGDRTGQGVDTDPAPGAAVIQGRFGPQPYPLAIPGQTLEEVPDLIEAFRRTQALSGDRSPPATLPGALLEALAAQVDRARGRVARLEEEENSLGDPDERQGWGDLLLARFGEVPSAATEVVLEGFDGTPVRIPLDPALTPDGNARRHYDQAARIRRARQRLPARIRTAREAWRVLERLRERALAGDASRDEVEEALPRGAGPAAARGGEAEQLPYRTYRSSGGLEIRVGRGAGRNDDLTFRHSSPDDIWLHARHTAGAHVVLRWGRESNPPERDLREAGILAALHSKARTSGSVPVDWTRRKYVRKPRKAPPGAVIPDRVSTVFVSPDPEVETRLRAE